MTFRPGALRGSGLGTPVGGKSGVIDYRLARAGMVASFKKGRLARHEVCDAHPELIRAAREVGEPTSERCPICDDADLVLVTYVFGPRLPPFGRCITSRAELASLARRPDALTCYMVEVCPACRWNHLLRAFPMGRPKRVAAAGG